MSLEIDLATGLLYLLVFPGFAFLFTYALAAEYVDRKLYARVQNRVGPPPLQPLADFLKLLAKESAVPEDATARIYKAAPLTGLAGVLTAMLYIPVWSETAAMSFEGDLVVVLFLLSLPSFSLFFGGWYSGNVFSQVGTTRTITQLFGYEIPFFLACFAPAVAAGTLELSGIVAFVGSNPLHMLVFLPAFVVGLLSLQAKLERIPFDAPEAESELATGALVEYSGRKLALFHLTKDVELVVGAALLSALFLGGPYPVGSVEGVAGAALGIAVFLVKTLAIVAVLSILRGVLARLRIEQVLSVFYRWLVPIGLAQIGIVLAVGLYAEGLL
ncbi:Membrane bound hydrogenase subunit mbhM protein [Halorhabdus tiamatea SARL4B]|uniref:Membrane bound hydrogenase subunit mbhM protein n=1 Tax=Halorhabdus tiamatea SARL4B TaxID=1033806 RepID=S6CU32_9EURY|nr:complex I subunit 1 family protein [Halorhabdus tiamatea]ERJ07221.1 Membrane bound hydrogenase subunit mbhM protein [Halorhabdus tiamatea SARL4B]CCQ34134.1 NADH-ubiquinone oxidoreductase, chain H [Halorhabdus tiamatea SARL4B]